ncbi:MAG: hypothetical protein HOP08_10250 [Cyclobacteriaceae bacterium]|nr:hypothetical protein [Cyclobacteriaceae bacterium]
MNQIETFLRIMLWIHIAGGTFALITGMGAMLTKKGSSIHRTFGKIYFWSMTAVFVGALALAFGHHRTFLLMVAFFSYYMTVRGYRILYLKNLSSGQKLNYIDWIITTISGAFILFLIVWGTYVLINGNGMGIVGLVFGLIGSTFLFQDLKKFFGKPPEKMHWWYGHIASMGGSYISAVTAFIVVNIQLQSNGWILWVLPALIGGILIGRTIRKYKVQFAVKAG